MKKQFMRAALAIMAITANIASGASLMAGQYLTPGQQLDSDDGRFMLVLQGGDGNLVVYRKADMVPLWATYKFGGSFAVVQWDRNFVVYQTNPAGGQNAIWDSKTPAANVTDPGTKLTMGNDGYLRLTDGSNRQLWTTAPPPPPVGPCPGGLQYELRTVCYLPGTTSQFQTVRLECPGSFIYYPYAAGICPYVPR